MIAFVTVSALDLQCNSALEIVRVSIIIIITL